jgi:hypothetical protein
MTDTNKFEIIYGTENAKLDKTSLPPRPITQGLKDYNG